MKKEQSCWLILLSVLLFAACKKEKAQSLNVDKKEISVIASGGETAIQITSNGSWSIQGLPFWLKAEPATGNGDTDVKLSFTANTTNIARTVTFDIKGGSDAVPPVKITVVQNAGDLAVTGFTSHAMGNSTIQIDGVGFPDQKEQVKVAINGKNATVESATSTKLLVIVPMSAGTGAVTVEAGGKTATAIGNFIYDWDWYSYTIAGNGSPAILRNPTGIAVSADGKTVYVADRENHRIRKLVEVTTGNYEIYTLAGSDNGEEGNIDGEGNAARFKFPSDITIDGDGNIFVVDGNPGIRRIHPNGTVSRVRDTNNQPWVILSQGVFGFGNGNIVLSDLNNNKVRQISASGALTDLAGGMGSVVPFNKPMGIAGTEDGKNFVVCDAANHRIQKVNKDAAGAVTNAHLIGSENGTAGKVDGDASATFNFPTDIAMDEQGSMYVADCNNNLIRKISFAANRPSVSTIAGSGASYFAEGIGLGIAFYQPAGISVNKSGTVILVADSKNNRIRRLVYQ